tara:strand:+ start:31 stop:1485 length:1455 start_codon:yes stop_codon:yes gene_type:complete
MVLNDFMGIDGFRWFIGVVEDRNDPEKASRVRVRCFGYHDDDLEKIPTKDLPWAQVLAPTDTPSMAGMGNTPHFLVEGSHVFGFFLDANFMQRPVVIGTIPGKPIDPADTTKGFFDPTDVYPKTLNEPDTNRLVRGSIGETHPALIKRRGMQQTEVPLSTKPFFAMGVQPGVTEDIRKTWNEPSAKSDAPTFYPFNHVHESECGHLHEVDDTPGGERLLEQHISGTFTEIHPTGDKVVKVVGKNYEIIVSDSNILIEGDLNVTVNGNKNELIKGDYVLEVEGDSYTKIHKNQRIRVGVRGEKAGGGNREEEILGSHAWDVRQSVKGRVGSAKDGARDFDVTIGGNETRIVGGNFDLNVTKNLTEISLADILINAKNNMSLKTTTGIVAIGSGSNVNIRSSAEMKIKSGGAYKLQSVGAANETFDSTYRVDYKGLNEFDHSGDRRIMVGADSYARHAAGVDHSCSGDPSRTSANDCTDPTAPTVP